MKMVVKWSLELRGDKKDIKEKVEEICKVLDGSEVELLWSSFVVDDEIGEIEIEKFLDE